MKTNPLHSITVYNAGIANPIKLKCVTSKTLMTQLEVTAMWLIVSKHRKSVMSSCYGSNTFTAIIKVRT